MTQPTLGKYHLLERLAADEIAEIYKVKTIGIAGFEKVQVLKRILPGCAQDPKFIRAFIDEAKIAFSLNHRNIVQVFEFGKVDGDLFLAMEYIPGANLHELMLRARRNRRLCPVGLTCYLMGEVAAGLEYAHRKTDHFGQELAIVHCDIRPRNIACSFEGSVKILDFGISRAVWTMVSSRGLIGWDPRHLSPEQLQGLPLTARSDLFSFGTMLWELLTGVPLFDGSTPEEIRDSILRKVIPNPASMNPDVPAHLDDLTIRCLERDPDRRIASASDLQMELHRIQRMLGAVIGSRALSAYIDELLPGYSDIRDVRQEGPEEQAAPEYRFEQPIRSDDLVDAAAELAQPPNPPAEAVAESREVAVTAAPAAPPAEGSGPQWDEAADLELDDFDDRLEAPIQRGASHEAAFAGVLRSSRLPDEEVVSRRRQRGLKPLSTISSEEVTAGPVSVRHRESDEITAGPILVDPTDWSQDLDDVTGPTVHPGAGPRPELPQSVFQAPDASAEAEELSLADVLEAEDEDSTEDETKDDTDRQASMPAVAPRRTESAARIAVAPKTLGEKKRFVACTVVLEGTPALVQEAGTLVADIAFKFDGILHDESGEKLVVLFGLPTADEHDLVTAIRFALDVQEALGSWRTTASGSRTGEIGTALEVSVGIRVGTARMGGTPTEEGYHLLGNTLAETETLARHVQAGQICLAGVAARLAAPHYVLRAARPLKRHGKQIRCYRVLGPRPREPHSRTASSVPFVAREVELKAIRSAWREAVLRSTQRAILIAGEPGIGKSRLVDEFIARQSTEAQVISACAAPHRRGTPYSLLGDLLKAATGTWNAGSSQSRARMLATLRELLLGEDDQVLRALESFVGPREAPSPEGGFGLLGLHHALRCLLNRLAHGRPLVVVLEDLHWADHASIDCLSALVERPEDASGPTFLLMTIRPDEELMPENLFASGSSCLLLEELDESDRRRLIQEEIRCLIPERHADAGGSEQGEQVNDEMVNAVERRAGGNPFYIRELSRALQELGCLAGPPTPPAGARGPELGAGATDIPPTIRGVVAARVDRLPAQVKNLLQHAAVIGPTFREGILATLIGRNPARSLGVLRNRGIIVPGLRTAAQHPVTAGKSEHFEREWAFRHVLIQEVVYDAISSVARRDLHRQVGEIMAKRVRRGSNDPPAEVAHHLDLGGLSGEAGEFCLRAANEAATAFAGREALALYDRALQLSEGDPNGQYEIHAGRERVHAQLGMHAAQASDLEALRRLSGDDPTRLADLRNREALYLLRQGEFYRALSAAEQAEAAATQAGDELERGEALQLRGEAYERLNDHGRAIDAVTKALRIFEEQQASQRQVRARTGLGRIYLVQARYDEAFDQLDPALELVKQTGDRWQERLLRYNLAVVHYCRGDFTQALDEALYSLKLCDQFGDRAREGDNASVVGIVYLELGLYGLARRYLEAAVAIHKETGSKWSEADTLVYIGLLEAAARRYHRALRFLDQAKTIAERIGAKYITVNARNAVAWTLCERGTTNDAVRATDEATEAAETARQVRLIVGEIPGLSRSARATAMLGNLEAARALSRRAVELLEEQRIIESSEEEIYYTHYRILSDLGDPSASEYLARAYDGYLSKLSRLDADEHEDAFSTNVRLNAAIRRDHGEG